MTNYSPERSEAEREASERESAFGDPAENEPAPVDPFLRNILRNDFYAREEWEENHGGVCRMFPEDPEPTGDIEPEQMGPPSPNETPRSIEDLFGNPSWLQNRTPDEARRALGGLPPGWREETLGKGSQKGNGFLLREYLPNGRPSGRFVSWTPGSAHHPAEGAYWKVTSPQTGTIRIK